MIIIINQLVIFYGGNEKTIDKSGDSRELD